MAQDWELMDQLPKFTVGDGEFCRTFWTQMAACTPALANRNPEELLARCQYLQQQQQQQQQDALLQNSTSPSSSSFSRPILFGPSPPVLSQWSIEWDRKDSKVVGQLQDTGGRTIWLNYHCIGRLSGDPLSDASSPSVLQLVSGGYLEAMGGRIYELGEARERRTTTTTTTASSPLVDHDYSMDTPLQQAMDAAKKRSQMDGLIKKQGESLDWLFPPVTASVSAFLACTVLSACIGYGAGLSIIADDHHPDQSSTNIPKTATTTTTTTTPAKSSTSTSSSTATTPSLAEQKARTEYRILKEQRLLQRMTERLEQDQNVLLELQQQQPNGGGGIYE